MMEIDFLDILSYSILSLDGTKNDGWWALSYPTIFKNILSFSSAWSNFSVAIAASCAGMLDYHG